MKDITKELLKQSDYDFEIAETLFKSKKYVYAVYMCHLSIEKALKGIYYKKLNTFPPKTHNLLFLSQKINIVFSKEMDTFLVMINEANIGTRYPYELSKVIKFYTKTITSEIIETTKEINKWIKALLEQ